MKALEQSELKRVVPLERHSNGECLSACAKRAVRRYLEDMGSEPARDIHRLVLAEVERPLLAEVLHWCDGNQSRAADILGINRATLRKRLAQYGIE